MYGHPRRSRRGGGSEAAQALGRIDRAVVEAHSDLLATGENVSAWKVAQAAMLKLQANSWDSLGFPMQQVPSLFRIMVIEGKVISFIHCFVGVQRITSLHDLELAICESEGVQRFEELELGPLLRHPLVLHYFSVGSGFTEVFKITTEEILSFLTVLVWRKKRKITPDDLLDYIAKRKKVDKENLCLRIQSLGMHISRIFSARQSENFSVKKCLEALEMKLGNEDNEQENDDELHDNMYVQSSGKISSQNMNEDENEVPCADLSAAEEKPRVWLDTEQDVSLSSSHGIRINDHHVSVKKPNLSGTISSFHEPPERMPDGSAVGPDLHVDNCKNEVDKHTSMFIKLWRDTCRDKNVQQVLEQMLDYYHKGKRKKNIQKGLKKFLKYPLVGLLNVGVSSIKLGKWDTIYEASQAFSQQGVADTIPKNAGYARIEFEEDKKDAVIAAKIVLESEHGVSVEDILKNVCKYLELIDDFTLKENPPPGKKLIFLRKLCKCESWLTEQFSIKEFDSLGFGDFFMFLEKHVSLLPHPCQEYFLTDDTCRKPSLEATMSKTHLGLFLSQASAGLRENEYLSKQRVLDLLMMQFPSACFTLVENGPINNFTDTLIENITNLSSSIVLFSATLIACDSEKGHSGFHVTTKDAIEVLLTAPMLIDLNSWSYWDLKFAPSLGPLVKWLLSEVKTKELMCLITKGGKVLRLDHSATLNSFLEAFLEGSPFQTAVKLLSLFALYGGEQNIPVSLLKCHAEKAFAFLLKGSTDSELDVGKKYALGGIKQSRSEFDRTIPLASRFMLECLGYLPEEFRSFAANLLLTGYQAIVKDAPSAILAECKHKEEYLILHELGSSLGIVEWVNNYSTLSLSLASKSSEPGRENDTSNEYSCPEDEEIPHLERDWHNVECKEDQAMANTVATSGDSSVGDHIHRLHDLQREKNATYVIESIRREEFGLDPNISASENSILRKQHARLGRALHCLSQELYSQDSHFLLELVQNADDNVYPRYVEPTLIFILQEGGIVVLNNELGFSTENIRALCDVGNSTKKGSTTGYIGKKGIGFKSVFRVTDAPEIHSNGFHIKFDLSEGQIGFVLPTIVPPCDVDSFSSLLSVDTNQTDQHLWNTCIVLPFRSKLTDPSAVDNITSMFSDLHPSLLLFLHRLKCIKFRNMLTNSVTIMRKEIVGEGVVNVSFGKENLTWFVESRKLQVDLARDNVQTTQISLAFALDVSSDGTYIPKLDQQCVFAFLPLRTYGLKFIIQGDFILPSSREEVDGDSPWNQWLLSEFPNLFVSAERSFCSLSGFKKNPGIAISAFMSFVPLVGEVHGFFSSLPRMIVSKLCTSNCLLLEGDNDAWVPPCKVLRNWTEQVRAFLPNSLVLELLGVGYLNKDIVLSDSLARSLGIEEYGPKILFQIISSLCRKDGGIKSMGLSWLSSWLNALYETSFHSVRQSSVDFETASDAINNLRNIPFIPLLDGTYGSISEGTIWLNIDALTSAVDNVYGLEGFPNLFGQLRIVNPALFDGSVVGNLSQILYRVGVQQLSTHEVLKAHVLPAISDEKVTRGNKDLMMEYLYFSMVHLQSSCPNCSLEREHIISEIYNKALISTNHGYKRLADVPIHFSKDFGNKIDIDKLIDGINVKWLDVDIAYLKYPLGKSSSRKMQKWRTFLKEVGVSDFVRVVQVEKAVADMPHVVLNNMIWDREILIPGVTVQDWESPELVHLLSQVSSNGDRKRCKYLLKVLDTIWDDYFSDKVTTYCNIGIERKVFKSSLVNIVNDVRWIASNVDNELHYPGDLFHDCEAVRSLLGDCAPYAVPKVHDEKLPTHIGFKTCVTSSDILSILDVWRRWGTPFKASVSQMSKFCTFIWNEMASSKQEIVENLLSGPFIFVPFSLASTSEEVVPGMLLSPQEVYWHDDTGSVEQIEMIPLQGELDVAHQPLCKMLCNIYPGLRDFFVDHCGVNENPPPLDYFQILLQLSTVATPSQAAKRVFQVFLEWADGLKSGILNSKDVEYLKGSLEKKESMVLPTAQDKWVSLHPSFGLVCWCDDEKLTNEFEGLYSVDFLSLCELSDEEKEMLHIKVSVLMQRLGIPCLSEVVTREAIYYGAADNSFETSLVSWALPYAQRYIHNAHPCIYSQLKLSGFGKLNRLRIVVVEKLFFRNVVKRHKIASKKRFECNCLLQGDILYTTPGTVSHSIFMELSSFLLDGIPELHLANFLHMITTMAESGSTEEQTEFFILNSQNVPRLPQEEQVWYLQSAHDSERKPDVTRVSRMIDERNSSNSRRKAGANSNWPPVNWRTAPKMSSSDPDPFISVSTGERHKSEKIDGPGDDGVSIEIDIECSIEEKEGITSNHVVSLENSEILEDEIDGGSSIGTSVNSENDSFNQLTASDVPNTKSSNVIARERLSFGQANAHQAAVTGKKGEVVAFKHLSKIVGEKAVKWMNEEKETGLPYDIVVGDDEKGLEYIEVKTTDSPRKDWFEISVGEWQFAVDKGESFSIVHVVLLGKSKARVSTYQNPVKLCRLGGLKLAILMPKQEKHVVIT